MEGLIALIEEYLSGEMKTAAVEFAEYLNSYGLEFYRDRGSFWKDKIYYWIKRGDECVCFIWLKGTEESENYWTVWSDGSEAYEDPTVSDEVKNAGWRHIDVCGSCGSCPGGQPKVIFGKKFPRVCGCTFRVDNAVADDLLFLKAMVDLIMNK